MRETRIQRSPNGLAANRLTDNGLADSILAALPLAVAVIDAPGRLLFWNQQAALLFGVPAFVAAEAPMLGAVLRRVRSVPPPQQARIVAFVAACTAQANPSDAHACLRLSLPTGGRIAIQVRALRQGQWMILIDNPYLAGIPEVADPFHDQLTGLSNRRHLNQLLQAQLDEAVPGKQTAVLLINLDRFDFIEKSFAPAVSHTLLYAVAQRLHAIMRRGDLVAHVGGDLFAVVIADASTHQAVAIKILSQFACQFLVDDHAVQLDANIGIALCSDQATSVDAIMRSAELALKQAKAAGGNTWRLFNTALVTPIPASQASPTDFRTWVVSDERNSHADFMVMTSAATDQAVRPAKICDVASHDICAAE